MRLVVLGAGALGAGFGALAHDSGVSVQLVARGAHLRALKERGLRFRTALRDGVHPIPASALDAVEPQDGDVLLFACKLPDLQELARVAAARWGDVPVLSMQNGIIGESWLAEHFSVVAAGLAYLPANVVAPGEVFWWGTPVLGQVHLGPYAGEGAGALARELGAVFAGAFGGDRFIAHLVDAEEIAARKRRKLWFNVVAVPLIVHGEAFEPVADAIRAECEAVFAADGLRLAAPDEVRLPGLGLAEIDGRTRPGPSLADSVRRGRPSEAIYTVGEVVRRGARLGVPTPASVRALADLKALGTAPDA